MLMEPLSLLLWRLSSLYKHGSEVGEMRYWLKRCPRCQGDLREESDVHGGYIACVQCGYILKQDEEVQIIANGVPRPLAPAEKVAA